MLTIVQRPPASLFFFNDTATTEIYTLSLHDALPISWPRVKPAQPPIPSVTVSCRAARPGRPSRSSPRRRRKRARRRGDRKSTRLNSSHLVISYAVFCLKKKKHEKGRDADRALGPCRV